MSLWGTVRGAFLSDEELGKKDDDHKATGKHGAGRPPGHWQPAARGPLRRSLKRIAVALVFLLAVYLFVQNIPTDLGPNPSLRPTYAGTSETGGKPKAPPPGDGRDRPRPPQANPNPKQAGQKSSSSPHDSSDTVARRTYNAPPKFLELAKTLQAIGGTNGASPHNRNVLFAASSLKSAAALLPVACQMGVELRNYVHFAVMSPTETAMDDLAKLNGIDDDCHILFHDARPDFVSISTEERLEYSVFRAFHHIQIYIHPQAIIIDSSEEENGYFQRGSRAQAKATGNTLIELPKNAAKGLAWMTKLDSSSLHAWNKQHIDILIYANTGGSGSLIRLLRSLSMADYSSSSVPHVTIELPHDIDPPTKHFLESFKWPPVHAHGPPNAHYLSLRHRIPLHRVSEEESSSRFLESFWPANPKDSHVLVLSPNVELSPQFFHYLRYSLMEYKYSTASRMQNWGARLMGISLEQPLTPLSGGKTLDAPRQTMDSKADVPIPFLWQAPASSAMLFMGDKWVELHDFVSRSLEAQRRLDSTPALLSEKLVSTQHPSWLEHALRLSRLRGYWTLYPGEETAKSLATVHNELHHPPEEYTDEMTPKPALADDADDKEVDEVMRRYKAGTETTLAPLSLLQSLPKNGGLEPFADMVLLAWDGKKTDVHGLDSQVSDYRTEFKKQVGGCTGEDPDKVVSLSARDLFCATE